MVIQSYHFAYIQVLKYVNIAGSGVPVSVDGVSLVNWTHEGHELAWDDPVEVSVLYLLVVLILFGIECLEVVPSEANTLLKTFKAMQDRAFIVTVSLTGVSERFQVWLVDLELSVSLFSVHLEDDNHESTH